MKILWIINIPLTNVCKEFNIPAPTGGSWLEGLKDMFENIENISLHICFPLSNIDKLHKTEKNNITYYAIPRIIKNINQEDINMRMYFKDLFKEINPDIIHIWGTEYPHTYTAVKVAKDMSLLNKVVISLQGLVSIIAEHYYEGLPPDIINSYTIRDFLKNDNIKKQKYKFEIRGEIERKTLLLVKNVIGRTYWDKVCSYNINKELNYYFCNEILRENFYSYQWNIEEIERNTIFMSQGAYPIKGLHYALKALKLVKTEIPNIKLFVAGPNITKNLTVKDKLKMSSYGKYILKLIHKYSLENNIKFIGNLSAKEMCNKFLKTHVYISTSTVENESNSLSEAKILGVPSVVSYAGGVIDRVNHGVTGFLYPSNSPDILASYILKILKDDECALKISENAKKNGREVNSKNLNFNKLLQIYYDISKNYKDKKCNI